MFKSIAIAAIVSLSAVSAQALALKCVGEMKHDVSKCHTDTNCSWTKNEGLNEFTKPINGVLNISRDGSMVFEDDDHIVFTKGGSNWDDYGISYYSFTEDRYESTTTTYGYNPDNLDEVVKEGNGYNMHQIEVDRNTGELFIFSQHHEINPQWWTVAEGSTGLWSWKKVGSAQCSLLKRKF